jgi:hypothetical protein
LFFAPIQILPTSLGATATPQGPFEEIQPQPSLAILEKKIVKFQTPAQFVEALLPFSKKSRKRTRH